MSQTTENSFKIIVSKCKDIFLKKNQDYGLSWTVMRLSSLTDQLYIKAKRIRNIQESNVNLVGDSQEDEFYSIINYCIMSMMLSNPQMKIDDQLPLSDLELYYDQIVQQTFDLMSKKNTDYGEVWRDMRVSSMTDLILAKLLRIKQIEDNQGKTSISEGVYSNYQDILNYAIFCIIKLSKAN